MAKTKNSDFPMILVGRQVLGCEVVFTDVLKVVKDEKELKAFRNEVKENARDMWGTVRKWPLPKSAARRSFGYCDGRGGGYEQWFRCKTDTEFWKKAGRIAAGKAAR